MTTDDRSPVYIAFVDFLAALLLCVIYISTQNPPEIPKAAVEMKAEFLATIEMDVNIDADIDIHMLPPAGKPVFFQARDVGCATLDRDNRGFMDSVITLADGSKTKISSNKETIAVRCIDPGHYDLAANLYANHTGNEQGIKVHAEIIGLNPVYAVLFSGDIVLHQVGETINWASFDMDRQGHITLTDPPLTPITNLYQHLHLPSQGGAGGGGYTPPTPPPSNGGEP